MKLGGNRGFKMNEAGRQASLASRRATAKARAADLAPVITELKATGVTSLGGIARALMQRRIPTARGVDRWTHAQVARVLAQMSA
jgi:hypothetical protein